MAGIWDDLIGARPLPGRRAAIVTAPAFVGGAGLYMSLPSEPHWSIAAVAVSAGVVVAVLARSLHWARWPAIWALAMALGFAWALVRADWAEAPRLEREGAGTLEGVVAWIDGDEDRPRLVLRDATFRGRRAIVSLKRARVRHLSGDLPDIGDRARLRAVMRPPPPPVAPGAYDFQRAAYFQGLGAVGFSIGPTEVRAGRGSARDMFGRARSRLRAQIGAALADRPGTAGVIAALTIGDRSGVPPDDRDALRASGLAHLLAISGLHLGLAAAGVYFFLRLLMAAPHGLALRTPAHKWAALGAILAAAIYLGLSGAAPPAQRAFVTVAAGMIAVMTDRLRSGLWFVAWAALAVAAFAPHVVVGPSFQLSFAAATAIVAAYEAYASRPREPEERPLAWLGRLRPAAIYFVGVAAASAVATAATTPLALAHFQQAPIYGVAANLAAMPIMAFVVMPSAVAAACAAPFGLADAPLLAMALGVEAILGVAHFFADVEGGVVRVAATADWVVAAFLIGGVWLCVARGPTRLFGALGPIAAFVGFLMATPPDVLVSDGGRLAAVVRDDALAVTSMRGGDFERESWRRLAGRPVAVEMGGGSDQAAACDDRGCVADIEGRRIALSFDPAGLEADCGLADVVIALHPAPPSSVRGCGDALVIDRRALARGGAHALRVRWDGVSQTTVRDRHGGRRWSGWMSEDQ